MAEMIQIKVLSADAQRRLSQLLANAQNQAGAMKAISVAMLYSTEQNFRQQGRPAWKPMSTLTRLSRGPGAKLLQKSGKLAHSITPGNSSTQAWVGTNVPYAAHQQFGTKAHLIKAKKGKALAFAGMFRKQVKHPGLHARPFLQLTGGDQFDILGIAADHLLKS